MKRADMTTFRFKSILYHVYDFIAFQFVMVSIVSKRVSIVCSQWAVDSAVGGRWQQPRRWSDYKNLLKARHAAGRHEHQQARPCFICPGSSVMSLDSELYYHANIAVESGHKFTVPMPEPVVRPCLYANKEQ